MAAVIVDSGSVIVSGGAAILDDTLTKDGATYDLTGKTVVVTIRAEADHATVINAALEDVAVTVDDPTNGGVTVALTTTMTGYLGPPAVAGPSAVAYYLAQFKVVTDNYFPQLLRFGVRRKLD